MRHFIIVSNQGRTRGDFKDLMSAGRMDIVIHSIINAFFLSNEVRQDVTVHVILNGPPDPPRHLEFVYDPESTLSKKDVGTLIKSALWKYKQGKKIRAFPGVFIEKRSFEGVLEDHKDKAIYLLDASGKQVDEVKLEKDAVFVLGDHEGLPGKERRFAKKMAKEMINIGPHSYFTSQCVTIINNIMDRTYGP